MIETIQFKRGLEANLPRLADGEPAFCEDTQNVYIGSSSGNKLVFSGSLTDYLNKLGDLTQLQTTDKDTLVHAINDNVASLAEIATNVKSYGAKGDGVTDDTAALQAAINYGNTNKMKVYFPYGQYVVTSSLIISNNTHLFGRDDFYDFGTSRGNALTRIVSKVNSGALFTSNGGVKISNFSFKGLSASDESTNTESIVFGFDMDYAKIINNYFYNFAKIIKGSMGFVSHFEMNKCINTKHIGIDGTITDSHIKNNYFNMSTGVQDYQTMGINGNLNLSSIVDNFIDFAFIGINATLATGSKVILNNIDYCITGIAIGGVDGTTFANNAFTHCSKQYASRLNLSAGNANNTTNWNGIVVNNTIYGLSIIGNNAMMSDVLCYMHNNNYSDIKTSGNVIDKSGLFSSAVLFDVNTSDIDKIIIEEHQYKIYSSMPSTSQVYEGQFFYFGNFLFRKLNGWFQLITCNLNSDLVTYSSVISVDMTNMPVRDSLILQVIAGDGFSGYSYKTYKIFKDSALHVVTMELFEANSSVASSTVTVSGNNIQIQFSGTSPSPKIAYRFLNQ
jgi:hypothetical protein